MVLCQNSNEIVIVSADLIARINTPERKIENLYISFSE
jgi:hypothetical protein